MEQLLPSFLDELEKISRATLVEGMEHDPMRVPVMQPGMYEFAGTPRILPTGMGLGYYKPPLPRVKGG